MNGQARIRLLLCNDMHVNCSIMGHCEHVSMLVNIHVLFACILTSCMTHYYQVYLGIWRNLIDFEKQSGNIKMKDVIGMVNCRL
jgi:hypothetical protein